MYFKDQGRILEKKPKNKPTNKTKTTTTNPQKIPQDNKQNRKKKIKKNPNALYFLETADEMADENTISFGENVFENPLMSAAFLLIYL